MTTETVKDYLGHPCKFTEAKKHFDLPDVSDRRNAKRMIGILLLEVNSRMTHLSNALEAMRAIESEDDSLHALLELAVGYDVETSNAYFELAGLVLASFDQNESKGAEVNQAESLYPSEELTKREALIFQAAGGIEAMTNALLREIDSNEDSGELETFTRMALNKIHALNSVILSIKGCDDQRTTEEMSKVVYG